MRWHQPQIHSKSYLGTTVINWPLSQPCCSFSSLNQTSLESRANGDPALSPFVFIGEQKKGAPREAHRKDNPKVAAPFILLNSKVFEEFLTWTYSSTKLHLLKVVTKKSLPAKKFKCLLILELRGPGFRFGNCILSLLLLSSLVINNLFNLTLFLFTYLWNGIRW